MLNLDPSSLENAPIDRCKGMVIYIIIVSCKKGCTIASDFASQLVGLA